VLDFVLVWCLRNVVSRRTPRLTAAAGLVFGAVVVGLTATRGFLIMVVSLWIGVRGLAALWAALSMKRGSRDGLLPLALAGLSLAFGGVLMFWTLLFAGSGALAAAATGYALCCVGLYAAVFTPQWPGGCAPRRTAGSSSADCSPTGRTPSGPAPAPRSDAGPADAGPADARNYPLARSFIFVT
jgi:hypothetical protein